MGKHVKAQIAIEFIFLVCVAFVMLIVLLTSIRDQAIDLNQRKDFVLVKDLAYKVQHEINMATQLKSGYNRIFFIPEKLDNKNYTIKIEKNEITVSLEKLEFFLDIPEINGNINKGNNTIKNIGGVVYLN
mgnify:CR=1 FL=1